MRDVAAMTNTMREYFKNCCETAKSKIPKPQKTIATLAGLCIELGINKDDLYAMQSGTDDEKAFFKDTWLRYEQAASAMLLANLIDHTTYNKLVEMFKEKSVESDNIVQVVFPLWNAPDDWEDYEDLKRIGQEHGLSFRQMKIALEKALGGVS